MADSEKKPNVEFEMDLGGGNFNWPTAIVAIVVLLIVALCCLGLFAPESFNAIFN